MENKFMPPPPSGMRNNMPPPPPPPRRDFSDVNSTEKSVFVPDEKSESINVSNQTNTTFPPREFPPRNENNSMQPLKQTNVVSEQEIQKNKEKVSAVDNKQKASKNLITVLNWGGFVVSLALFGLFIYLMLL